MRDGVVEGRDLDGNIDNGAPSAGFEPAANGLGIVAGASVPSARIRLGRSGPCSVHCVRRVVAHPEKKMGKWMGNSSRRVLASRVEGSLAPLDRVPTRAT